MNCFLVNPFGDPSPADQAEFVLRLYFGKGDDKLRLAIRRAYQDFSRTMHGINEYPDARPLADHFIYDAIAQLAHQIDDPSGSSFDMWHKQTSLDLCNVYSAAGYKSFCVGQAQKWINMALKYVFVFGETSLSGYQKWYPHCHVPIDNIILEQEEFRNLRSFECAWSRISDYGEYMAFQSSVRNKFKPTPPLTIEFWTWQRNS